MCSSDLFFLDKRVLHQSNLNLKTMTVEKEEKEDQQIEVKAKIVNLVFGKEDMLNVNA